MARRTTPIRPERPVHSVEEKRRDIERLQRRIADLEAFDPNGVTSRFSDPGVTKLQTAIGSTLASVFGHGTIEYDRYASAAQLDHGPVSIQMDSSWISARGGGGYQDDRQLHEAYRYLTEGKAESLALLQQAVEALEEEIEFAAPVPAVLHGAATREPATELSRRVFIVHGHDEGAREAVARYLERIGFEPVILHEQANQGRSVIEKVEAHGDVSFAVVLLTPDDEGAKVGEALEPRARQNVLLELGYFIGRLGRPKVCALMRGTVSIPSDFAGVVWEQMDVGGGWRQSLARELQAAGHEIDWNTVMRQ
jgi:predicted nucleotide-binding protein